MAAPGCGSLLPGRCAHFVERKKRFCKMTPAPGRRFCGEHGQQEEENDRKRIPCPLDPKHTVYEDQLQKHLKKCNSREKPKPVYFVPDINAGFSDGAATPEKQVPISALSEEELENLITKLKNASIGLELCLEEQILSHQALQEALNDPRNGESAFKHLKQQREELCRAVELCCAVELCSAASSAPALGVEQFMGMLKHVMSIVVFLPIFAYFLLTPELEIRNFKRQIADWNGKFWEENVKASILGNMEKLHLLGPGRCFVEFGAGRGKLSHWVDVALENVEDVQFLLVERAPTRHKVDAKHRDSVFERLRVDIQHLCLSKVPVLEKKKLPVVGIGKHLCGAATDLALRCLVESYTMCCDGESEEPAPKRCRKDEAEVPSSNSANNRSNKADRGSVAGIVIAVCCHHKCDWTHYVGREFFQSAGLGAAEFHYFQRMSSWATCGMGGATDEASGSEDPADSREQECSWTAHAPHGTLTAEERKEIGYLCKLLIDHGRVEYLQRRGYTAALQYYTEPAVSLENVLLTAVPHPSSIPEPAS